MKQIVFLAIVALNVGLLSSCEKNKDPEVAKLQGVWMLKTSDNHYEYIKITENGIFVYSCSIDPKFMFADFKYSMNYTYNEKTKTISETLEGETDYIEVVELTSSSITIKDKQQCQTLERVDTQKDFAPESLIGMTFGRSTDNYWFKSNNTLEVIDTWADYFQTVIIGEPSYIYTKTGENTATLQMQYKKRSQLYDKGYEENVEINLNLLFSIPTIGIIESGNCKSNGISYSIINGEWIPDEPINQTVDCTADDFILR